MATRRQVRCEPVARAPRTAVVTCAVLEQEVTQIARGQPHVVRIEQLPQRLHADPVRLRAALQRRIDRLDETLRPAAVVLVFGLCGMALAGLRARRARLVVARAHDCISLLLGDRRRHERYQQTHPGTYWHSPGWNREHTPPGPERVAALRAGYHERHRAGDADHLMAAEQHWLHTYDRAAYVHLGFVNRDPEVAATRRRAGWLGWAFEELAGDPAWIEDLLAGRWDDARRILVVEPGETVRATGDGRLVEAIGSPR